MTTYNYEYENYLRTLNSTGVVKGDRTGTGTISRLGLQMRFDLTKGFPLVTTKKVHMKSIVHELIWFLAGETNIAYLKEQGVTIWDDWADPDGELGPVYGHQWRSWPGNIYAASEVRQATDRLVIGGADLDSPYDVYQEGIDQIANVVQRLKDKPDDRRLIVSAWNPADIERMKLPPCHCLFQFYTRPMTLAQRAAALIAQTSAAGAEYPKCPDSGNPDELHATLDSLNVPRRYLDCQLYQRSADSFLGVPFNIASYALLTSMVAQQVDMVAGEFVWTGGDCHIYSNHHEQVALQLSRDGYDYPTLKLNKAKSIFDYKFEDVEILNYQHQPAIKAPVAV